MCSRTLVPAVAEVELIGLGRLLSTNRDAVEGVSCLRLFSGVRNLIAEGAQPVCPALADLLWDGVPVVIRLICEGSSARRRAVVARSLPNRCRVRWHAMAVEAAGPEMRYVG